LSSLQLILSYLAWLVDATVEEQPAATSSMAGKLNRKAAVDANFILYLASPLNGFAYPLN
jgi:hypothetical protein